MNSSPSSNKLSLEGAGNNPCGLVQSNSNPQHIITMAGSPLHCCSRTGAGGVHMDTRTHVDVVTIIISGSNLGKGLSISKHNTSLLLGDLKSI